MIEDVKQETDTDAIQQLRCATIKNILYIINYGSVKDIKSLKMVGKKRAEAIFEYRSTNGVYNSLNDLQNAGLKPGNISSIFKANLDI